MGEAVNLHIGGYHLTETIGSGAMGVVFKGSVEAEGKSLPTGTTVAVKLLHPHLRGISEFVKRFHREAKLASKIRHGNVVQIFDVGIYTDLRGREYHFLAMEYATGLLLDNLLKDRHPFSSGQTVEIMRQLCEALKAAQMIDNKMGPSRSIVHRDIKPQNIILQPLDPKEESSFAQTGDKKALANFRIKLLDYGLAKDVEALSTILSQTGQSLGTPAYMSPEQCRGGDIDQRSDLYSLGVVMYQMITGSPPFTGPTPVAYAQQHAEEIPPDILLRNPQCPKPLADVINRCLAKDPNDRYQTPDELAADLQRVSAGLGINKIHRFRKKLLFTPTKMAVVLTACLALAWGLGWGISWLTTDQIKSFVREQIRKAEVAAARGDYAEAENLLNGVIAYIPERPDREQLVAPAHDKLTEVLKDAAQAKNVRKAEAARKAELEQQQRERQAKKQTEEAARIWANQKTEQAKLEAEAKAKHQRFLKYRDEGIAAFNRKEYSSALLALKNALKEEEDADTCNLLQQAVDKTTKQRIAVVDFAVKGEVGIKDAGAVVAEMLLPKFSLDRYELIERSLLARILEEHNLTMMQVVENPAILEGRKISGVRYLVVGSVVKLGNLAISARLVDVNNGKIIKSAEVNAPDAQSLQNTLGYLADQLDLNTIIPGQVTKNAQPGVMGSASITANTQPAINQKVMIMGEQAVRRLFNEQIEKLKAHVSQNRFELARHDMQYAQQVLEANWKVFNPVSGYDELKTSLDGYSKYIDIEETVFMRKMKNDTPNDSVK